MQRHNAETRSNVGMTINTCHLLGFNGQCFFVRGNGLFTSTAVGQRRTQLVPQTVIVLPMHDGPEETKKQRNNTQKETIKHAKQNIQQQQQKYRLIEEEQLKNKKNICTTLPTVEMLPPRCRNLG
jgi:hypothetical protein